MVAMKEQFCLFKILRCHAKPVAKSAQKRVEKIVANVVPRDISKQIAKTSAQKSGKKLKKPRRNKKPHAIIRTGPSMIAPTNSSGYLYCPATVSTDDNNDPAGGIV